MTEQTSAYLAANGERIHVFDDEVRQGFFEWFEQGVLRLDTEEYRRRYWYAQKRYGWTIGHEPRTYDTLARKFSYCRRDAEGVLFVIACLMGACYGIWVLKLAVHLLIRRLRRSSYYEHERGRRRMLADERRAIRVRRTVNPRPTVTALRAAYAHVHDSPQAALRFGGMLQDLECYVDNHAFVDPSTGEVRGRAGGIKRYFQAEIPEMFDHYKQVMAYKARAKKYLQACDAADPIPVDALLPISGRPNEADSTRVIAPTPESAKKSVPDFPCRPELESVAQMSDWMKNGGNTSFLMTQSWLRKKRRNYTESDVLREDQRMFAREILTYGDGTMTALDAAIALKIDPNCVPEGEPTDPRIRTLKPGHRAFQVPVHVRNWILRHRRTRSAG